EAQRSKAGVKVCAIQTPLHFRCTFLVTHEGSHLSAVEPTKKGLREPTLRHRYIECESKLFASCERMEPQEVLHSSVIGFIVSAQLLLLAENFEELPIPLPPQRRQLRRKTIQITPLLL